MTAAPDPFAYDRAEHEASVEAWRRARLSRLTAADGWLSLVGRFPLEQGDSSVGSADTCDVLLAPEKAPAQLGVFHLRGKLVTFTPLASTTVSLAGTGGEPLAPGTAVPLRSDRDGTADRLVVATPSSSITLEITERESGMFVRVRDAESPTRRDFTGIEHYPIAPKWRVVAKLERYAPHRTIDLAYEANSVQHYESPGAATFEIDGESHRLDVMYESDRRRLFIVFWDPTARDTTYGAGRFLYAPLPEGDRVLLDFNLAFSPPCAFTPYAACPLAPAQNRLMCRVEAGEQSPH